MANVEVLHVVRALHVLVDIAAAGAAERLDGVHLVLLHTLLLATFDDRHRLPRVDPCTGAAGGGGGGGHVRWSGTTGTERG